MSRESERLFTVQREGDVAVEVTFTWTPGCAAKVSGPPEDCYPAEAPEIDIKDVTIVESDDPDFPVGTTLTLTEEEEGRFFTEWCESAEPEDEGPDPDILRDDRADPDFDYYGD